MVIPAGDGGFKPTFTEFRPPTNSDSPFLGEATQGFDVQKTKKQREAEELALSKKKQEEELALSKKKQQEEIDMLPTKGYPSKFFEITVDANGQLFLKNE